MKVLRVLHNLGIGGIQRQLLALLPFLSKDMEIHICTLSGGGDLEERFRALGVPVRRLNIGWKYGPWGMARLARLISRGGYNLVHVHRMEGIVFPVVVASLSAGVPVVVHHHFLYGWSSKRKLLLESWATRKARGVVAVSHPVMEHSSRSLGLETHRMEVIYNGAPVSPNGERDFHPWRVGMVARMVRHKRVDLFLQGAARLVSLLVPVEFRLVGGGEREERYREMARSLQLEDRVTFTGYTLEVEKEVSRFALGVLPSENEGFPNTLLEYGSLGLPMVVSSIPQNREVVEDGREGVVVPVGDVEALARAEAHLLLDRAAARKAGIMARRRVSRFSLEKTARRFRDVYGRLLRRRDPSSPL